MTSPSAHFEQPANGASRCEQLLADFDRAWRNGLKPRLDDFLPPPGATDMAEADRLHLLGELVHIDLEGRWRLFVPQAVPIDGSHAVVSRPSPTGTDSFPEHPIVEDYLQRLPELGGAAGVSVELIGSEYFARRLWGDKPTAAEYQARFAGRFLELQQALSEVDAELEREFARATRSALIPAIPMAEPTQIRCPHCRSGFPAEQHPAGSEVTCPSRGGRFALDDAHDAAVAAPPFPRIGRYILGARLGAGAFGSVWQAFDCELRREVAVKLPRGGRLLDGDEEERFLREARAAAGLQHEGIVPVHDTGRENGTLYIVTELVRGQSLAELLARERPGFRESAALVARIADALDYAHLQGVVHRDLKPSNILLVSGRGVRGEGSKDTPHPSPLTTHQPKITDFGLAKCRGADVTMTLDGHILGTPTFMSPEQVRDSHHADGRSDIYSVGVILYQLLTGELPFTGLAPMVFEQVQHDEPRRPRRLNQKIPADLETITLKCMAKEPRNRYASAGALAEDLRRWLAGEPIRARPAGPLGRLWRWARRKPVIAGLSAAVILMLVLVTVVSLTAMVRIGRERDAALAARQQAEESAAAARKAQREAEANEKAAQAARSQADTDRDRALDSLAQLVTVADRHLSQMPGTQQLRGNILRAASANLERMASESEKAGARRGVYSAYLAQGNLFWGVGNALEARKYYEKAVRAAEEAAKAHPGPGPIGSDLAGMRLRMCEISLELGDALAARRWCDSARTQAETVLQHDPKNADALLLLAHAHGKLFEINGVAGADETTCRADADRSRALFESLEARHPGSYQKELGLAYLRLAESAVKRHDLNAARDWLARSHGAYLTSWTANKYDPRAISNLANVSFVRGNVALRQAKLKEAEAHLQDAQTLFRAASRGDPYAVQAYRALAECLVRLSVVRHNLGDPDAARRHGEEAVKTLEKLSSWDPQNLGLKRQLADALSQVSRVQLHLAVPEGREVQARMVKLREEVLKADPKNPKLLAELGVGYTNLGAYHLRLHQFLDAVPWYRRAMDVFGQLDPAYKVDDQTADTTGKGLIEFIALCEAAPAALEDMKVLLAQPVARRCILLAMRAGMLARRGQRTEAVAALDKLHELAPAIASAQYGIACGFALCSAAPAHTPAEKTERDKDRTQAVETLQRAVDLGFKDLAQLTSDPDLASLRERREYQELIQRLQPQQ